MNKTYFWRLSSVPSLNLFMMASSLVQQKRLSMSIPEGQFSQQHLKICKKKWSSMHSIKIVQIVVITQLHTITWCFMQCVCVYAPDWQIGPTTGYILWLWWIGLPPHPVRRDRLNPKCQYTIQTDTWKERDSIYIRLRSLDVERRPLLLLLYPYIHEHGLKMVELLYQTKSYIVSAHIRSLMSIFASQLLVSKTNKF